jgi:hypothetical protein
MGSTQRSSPESEMGCVSETPRLCHHALKFTRRSDTVTALKVSQAALAVRMRRRWLAVFDTGYCDGGI